MHHFSTVHYVVSLHKHSFPIITRSNEYIIKWHLEILVFGCTLFYLNGILFNIEWNEAAGTSFLSYLCELAVGSYSWFCCVWQFKCSKVRYCFSLPKLRTQVSVFKHLSSVLFLPSICLSVIYTYINGSWVSG